MTCTNVSVNVMKETSGRRFDQRAERNGSNLFEKGLLKVTKDGHLLLEAFRRSSAWMDRQLLSLIDIVNGCLVTHDHGLVIEKGSHRTVEQKITEAVITIVNPSCNNLSLARVRKVGVTFSFFPAPSKSGSFFFSSLTTASAEGGTVSLEMLRKSLVEAQQTLFELEKVELDRGRAQRRGRR